LPENRSGNQVECLKKHVWITAYGEQKIIADWLRDPRCQATEKVLRWRLAKGVEGAALFEPARKLVRWLDLALEAFGETRTVREWVRDSRCKANERCVTLRLKRGLTLEQAITEPMKSGKKLEACSDKP
jgi:hypothetical protein